MKKGRFSDEKREKTHNLQDADCMVRRRTENAQFQDGG